MDTEQKPIISSESPNLRFGYSGLDKEYRSRAAMDEILIDKRTGQMIYKRKTDGKLVSFTRDSINAHDYITQLKTLIDDNLSYVRPTSRNCQAYADTYFTTFNMDLIDFSFREDSSLKTFLSGGESTNPYNQAFSFTQETNGVFFYLEGRQRDHALISMLNSIYNNYYKNYEGTDEQALREHNKFDNPKYEDSQAVVNYTITYYQSNGLIYAQQTANGYVRINELSYVPFINTSVYSRDVVAYAKMEINYITTPKLAAAISLLKKSGESVMLDSFIDNEDIEFQTLLISTFVTSTDKMLQMPSDKNTFPAMVMNMDELDNELNRIGSISNSSGIIVSALQPDEVGWAKTMLWIEPFRNVYNGGETEETHSETDFSELEKFFGSFEILKGIFTGDINNVSGYYIEKVRVKTLDLSW